VILGWDIGGVNTKVARLDESGALGVRSRPFELQHDPDALVRVLIELAREVGSDTAGRFTCAVTMTAELSQMFRTKREGVGFVLDAVSAAFPNADVRVFTTDCRFLSVDAARRQPTAVAAANWTATACLVAERCRSALLIDVGTTTTDIIPVVDGEVVALGKTDPDRLASGELVYTGALRTPVEAIVRDVPYRDGRASVSAEAFALIGDVHLWRKHLALGEYTVPTPDGRAVTREFAGERIARVICADRELLDESDIERIAESVAAEQVSTIAAAIRRVRSRHPSLKTAVVTGLGEFIAREAALAAGLNVVSLADDLGVDAARYAPATAVALLAGPAKAGHYAGGPAKAEHYAGGPAKAGHNAGEPAKAGHYAGGPAKAGLYEAAVDLVIKVGGGLLEHVEHLDRVLNAIGEAARAHRVVIVPGGGPFADAVRHADGLLGLGADAAHWMAILGMDQHAHLLASRLSGTVVVWTRDEIDSALGQGRIPVLAPSRWLSAADPLPHSWDVTSDSIAAWFAGELGAGRLLLVKPPGARGAGLVDAYFERALPSGVAHDCLAADEAVHLLTQMAGIAKPAFETT
jgi:probable H4MPT-linked C1 transfer pathway protein